MTFPIIPARTASSASYQVSRSLRFRRSAVGNLTRTFGTPTTQNTFSFSCWTKRGLLSTLQIFFGYSNLNSVYFTAADNIALTNGTTTLTSTAVYRDPSAWYHILYTQSGTTANIYVNGTLAVTGTCSVSFNTASVAHCIGSYSPASSSYDGYIAEVYFVDGQVKAVSDFTATDATTGVIGPKAYTGTYGNNGFYLPFNASATSSYAGSFNGSSQYLTTAVNANLALGTSDFTIEYWMNFTSIANGAAVCTLGPGTGTYDGLFGYTVSTQFSTYLSSTGGSWDIASARSVIPTITAGRWYHIAYTRSGSTFRVFVDGVLADTFTSAASLYQSANQIAVGRVQSTNPFNGLVSNLRVVKGTALYTSNFTPPVTALTAVTNTQLLTLQSSTIVDNSANALTITNTGSVTTSASVPWGNYLVGQDTSGAGNNFLPNNINATSSGTTYDSMLDSPTNYADGGTGRGNYAVLNPLDKYSTNTVSDGNLATNGLGIIRSTFGMTSGKWYWEFIPQSTLCICGIAKSNAALATYLGGDANGWSYYANGNKYNSGPVGAYGATYTTNDIIGVAFDADNGTLTFYKNGTSQGVAFTGLTSGPYFAATSDNAATAQAGVFNFGQRPFTYTPPSGFSALNTQNLPTPTIAAGNKYFDATTYGGNSTVQNITNSGSFQPDFVWIKCRSSAYDHILNDVIRGAGTYLVSNTTAAETTNTIIFSAFNSNGFQLNNAAQTNSTGQTYVGWQWNAGGSTVTNNAGTISSQVRANPTAGFSVVTWTHNGSSGTIGHGLGVAPTVIIAKTRNGANDWFVYSSALGNTKALYLDLNAAAGTTAAIWNNTSPTSSVFTAGTTFSTNTCVAYCFAPISGYSSFGTYTGNGSADGTFVYLGFRPKFIIIKKDGAAANWRVHDSSRSPNNLVNTSLYPNLSNAEYTPDSINEDFLSNGFKLRSADGESNASGAVYFYMAFAENPFQLARAR